MESSLIIKTLLGSRAITNGQKYLKSYSLMPLFTVLFGMSFFSGVVYNSSFGAEISWAGVVQVFVIGILGGLFMTRLLLQLNSKPYSLSLMGQSEEHSAYLDWRYVDISIVSLTMLILLISILGYISR